MLANSRAAEPIRPPLESEPVPGLGPDAFASELAGMIDRPFCFSQKYGEQQGRADRTGAQAEILEFERTFVKRANRLGIPLFAHCVNRGSEEQNRLFSDGRSKARAGESPHNFGAAVDIIHGTKGWQLTRRQWAILGHIGKELAGGSGYRVKWGGDWEFYDPAHWELSLWRDIRASYSDGEDWDGR